MRTLLALLVLLCACGREPPATITIDPGFSEAQEAAILDALDHWCDAVGWCPELVDAPGHDGGRITPESNYSRFGRGPESAGFFNGDRTVRINLRHPAAGDLLNFWNMVAHEIGHFGIDGHTAPPGVMNRRRDPEAEVIRACLDEASAEAWCAEQGCLFAKGTCGL